MFMAPDFAIPFHGGFLVTSFLLAIYLVLMQFDWKSHLRSYGYRSN